MAVSAQGREEQNYLADVGVAGGTLDLRELDTRPPFLHALSQVHQHPSPREKMVIPHVL